jgi:hypothetical protein
VEASASSAWSTINLGVTDLDATELPSNDRDINEVVLERMLANLVESGIEAPEAAMSATATSGVSSIGAPVSGAATTGQPAPGQGGDAGGPVPQSRRKRRRGFSRSLLLARSQP